MTDSLASLASRRAGGRRARQAMRSAPLEDHLRPIWPGMHGPTRGPLDEAGMRSVGETVFQILEEIGFAEAPPFTVETLTSAGAVLDGETGRVRFPRSMIEDAIAGANRDFTWCGRRPEHDIRPCGDRLYFGTGGAAVHIVDLERRVYGESALRDLYDAARIADVCDNIHYFHRSMVARDMESMLDLDINTLYACLAGTTKHVGMSICDGSTFDRCLEMIHMVAGGEDEWRRRPFVTNGNCFVVPPLKFAHDSCEVLERAVRAGMPLLIIAAGQAGATAPAALAGAVAQGYAEAILGMVYANAVRPGHPVLLGAWPFVSDLRTGAMSGGSGEQSLLSVACGQMGRYFGLPTSVPAGMTDAKLPDAQAGYEKGLTISMAAMSGANMINEAAGMQASLLGFSQEAMIIDNDLIGASMRCARGIEVTEDSCSVETIRKVCTEGPGHFLGTDQTLSLMQTEYVYPSIGDRSSPKEWAEMDRPDILQAAARRKREILASHFPDAIDDQLDQRLRAAFDIRLPREAMEPLADAAAAVPA